MLAKYAEINKTAKYSDIMDDYNFIPVAIEIETLVAWSGRTQICQTVREMENSWKMNGDSLQCTCFI